MASYYLIRKLPRHIAVEYYKLKSSSSKIRRTSSSIGFIYKAIFYEIIPTFAKVKGKFVNKEDKSKAEKSILQSHLTIHRHNLKNLNNVGVLLFNFLYNLMLRSSREDSISQLKCKNKKLGGLIS